MKIDVFSHFLPQKLYQKMLEIEPNLADTFPYVNNPILFDPVKRQESIPEGVKQVISAVNINPEDFARADTAAKLCRMANEELNELAMNNEKFLAAVAMLPMNNLKVATEIIHQITSKENKLIGAQIFTRALGKSIADESFDPIFAQAEKDNVPLLLHPVFDERKPDNNLVFSWEYELGQAMLQLTANGIFEKYPKLKIIVHHAGSMVPFFAERINHILPKKQADDFKKFYVDTAILGNPSALKLALDYYGSNHILFGTDAPFGIQPAGATNEIISALKETNIEPKQLDKVFYKNFYELFENNI